MSAVMKDQGKKEWFYRDNQRIQFANLSVSESAESGWIRIADSNTSEILAEKKMKHLEPWNVEQVNITSKGIVVCQYPEVYSRNDQKPGKYIPDEVEYRWMTTFESSHMKNLSVREFHGEQEKIRGGMIPRTLIELIFDYEGSPQGEDATLHPLEGLGGEQVRL